MMFNVQLKKRQIQMTLFICDTISNPNYVYVQYFKRNQELYQRVCGGKDFNHVIVAKFQFPETNT